MNIKVFIVLVRQPRYLLIESGFIKPVVEKEFEFEKTNEALEYVGDDELVEVTPKSVRLRKMILDEAEARRKKSQGF